MELNNTLILLGIVLANIGTTIGMFTWATGRSDANWRESRESTQAILSGMALEMKDFHGRLCEIEATRNRG